MRVIVDGYKIPLKGDITLKFYNPMFNNIGAHSLPLNFDAALPLVQKAFRYPSTPEAEVLKSLPGYVDMGLISISGTWKIISADSKVIRTYFTMGTGDVYSYLNKMYLPDIDFGGVKYPAGPSGIYQDLLDIINTKLDSVYPDSEYTAYCAYMPQNTGKIPVSFFVNRVSMGDGIAAIQLPIAGGGSNSIFLFAGTIIDYLFNSLGYRIEENIFRTDSELQRLTIFNTYNIFPPVSSPNFNIARLDYSKLVPKILCSDFIKALRDRFNIGFFINEQSRTVKIKKFDDVIKEGPLDTEIEIGETSVSNNRYEGLSFPLNAPDEWSEHDYDGNTELSVTATVDKYRDILPATRNEEEIFFVQSEQTYYKIVLDAESDKVAERICPNQFPYSEGDGSEEMSQLSGCLSMYTYSTIYEYDVIPDPPEEPVHYEANIDYLLPRCDLKGNREGDPYTPFPLMFVSARGFKNCWVEDLPGAPVLSYPLGSTDLFDASGDALSGAELALKWGDASGIIMRYWVNRLNWEQNIKKLVSTDVIVPFLEVLKDFSKILRIRNNNYLVNSFDLVINNKSRAVSNAELLRL